MPQTLPQSPQKNQGFYFYIIQSLNYIYTYHQMIYFEKNQGFYFYIILSLNYIYTYHQMIYFVFS